MTLGGVGVCRCLALVSAVGAEGKQGSRTDVGEAVHNLVRSLWKSVQGDPAFMRRVNGWLTIFWVLMIPVSIITGWISSVTYVAALSIWALVAGHWSTWQAARVEVTQQQEAAERAKHPVEQKVVKAMVDKTDVERSAS